MMMCDHVEPVGENVGPSVSTVVRETLGGEIVRGVFELRSFPSESEIMARFRVSRSSAREAVKMLSAKGLLTSRPKLGISVAPLERWSLYDADVLRWLLRRVPTHRLTEQLFELRLAMEPSAAALAAASATHVQRREIDSAARQLTTVERAEEDTFAAEQRFHSAVLRGTRNPFYVNMIRVATASMEITRRRRSVQGCYGAVTSEVAQAIAEGRGADAAAAMRALLSRRLANISQSLR